METPDLYDVTIIGSGPAGLYSAFYSGLRSMKTKIIEFQPKLGGKVHVYPQKMIWDVGGLTPVTGEKLIEQLVTQGLTFDPTVTLNEKVVKIEQNEDKIFVLYGESGQKHYSKTVIVAIGAGILKPLKLNVEGVERYEESHLHYTVKSLKQFENKKVIISGGGNSAVDWAIELLPYAKQVYVTYRKESLKGHEAQVELLTNSSAQCFYNTSITKINGASDQESIESVELTNHLTGEVTNLPIDDVIINHGYERDAELLNQCNLGIKQVQDYYIEGTTKSQSSVDGLYAAGDILMYDGKVGLIAGAFQDAINAVNKAKQYVEPEASNYAMVSSHNELFKEKNEALLKQQLMK
ncbi:NAD(P)/FAD-dependent oxidoreductase [Aquibacillus koreensis]|uniref:Ferredoxin--NADP reductase n=1 Tax=Aquibacillus koreensis TaxID=279446 RepID=A0A9X4AH32_9BACI|nr:NAD(P)/FAD-dependent oxidoreductase [Aquibacillus koreensis]MCT2534828.1 NAD(P)/FAD-dependent oxidoreductase [Aquibacillus koreensis]MDC3419561.1 NAD(P)/FAD-dependent oxidoreductase [Aquibacillus koreensis]